MTAEIADMVAAGDKAACGTGKGGFIPACRPQARPLRWTPSAWSGSASRARWPTTGKWPTPSALGASPLPAQREQGYPVVLRRQPASIIDGRPEGSYAGVFEVFCRDCGDDPGLDYRQISPRLQRIHGPYPIVSRTLGFAQ